VNNPTFHLLGAVVALCLVFIVTNENHPENDALFADRDAYRTFIEQHPYSNRTPLTSEEIKALPKHDRPDLAMEQDFLATMDPSTGTVPGERLFQANEFVTQARLSQNLSANIQSDLIWTERGPSNVGGRTRAIMWDPNVDNKVWAGGVHGGLWFKSNITNSNDWISVNDFWANMAISTMAYDPSNTQTFYVGTGESMYNADAARGAGIFKSTDGGNNWSRLASTHVNSDFHWVPNMVVSNSGTVLAATRNAGVMRSTDGGNSWTSTLGGPVVDIELDANGNIYAAFGSAFTAGDVFFSTDDGQTWTTTNFPVGSRRIEIQTAPSDADVVYATGQNSSFTSSGVFRYDAATGTWTTIAMPNDADGGIPANDFTRNQAWYDLSLAVDPNDADHVYIGGIDLFQSTNAGDSWIQVSHWYGGFGEPYVHADQHGAEFKPGSSSTLIVSHDGGIDWTNTANIDQPVWVNKNLNYNVTQFYAGAINPNAGSNIMMAGAQDNGTQYFNSAGVDVTTSAFGGDGAFTFIDQDDPDFAICSYVYNNYYRSTNGGQNCTQNISSGLAGGRFINPADYDDVNNILYTTSTAQALGRVSNLTTSPTGTLLTGLALGAQSSALKVSPFSPTGVTTLFVGSSSGDVVRIDGAQGNSPVVTDITGNLPFGYVSSIEFGSSQNQILIAISNYGISSVWETLDGGANWIDKEGNLPDIPVRWAMYNPDDNTNVILATEAGIFETTDLNGFAVDWTPSTIMPITRVSMLQYRPSDQTIMATTHGRGVWTSSLDQSLPVELANFEANDTGSQVEVSWTTSSETDNAYFDLEYKVVGEGDDSFASYQRVDGAGTTTESQNYSIMMDLDPGMYNIRLKQVDFSGSFEYSDQLEVEIELPAGLVFMEVYPNPLVEQGSVSLMTKERQNIDLELFDINGRRISTVYSGVIEGQQRRIFGLDFSGNPAGNYFLRVKGGEFEKSQLLIVQ